VETHVDVQLNSNIVGAIARGNTVELSVMTASGEPRRETVDHVIAATGYRPDLRRLPFLESRLCREIAATRNIPQLSGNFETSVPGLYVTGLAAAYSFGPVLRFAYGADFTARTLTRHLSRKARDTSRDPAEQNDAASLVSEAA
jgi:NADPH-dependent 2,4-dienoyl-CoA reductase/sulfur reductase-like enzyme